MFFYLERQKDHSMKVEEAVVTYDLGYFLTSHYALIVGKGSNPVHVFDNREKAIDAKECVDHLIQKIRDEHTMKLNGNM